METDTLRAFILHPLTQATLAGWIVAARQDYNSFLTWRSFDDAAQYDWRVAAFRQLQGLLTGLVGGLSSLGLYGLAV